MQIKMSILADNSVGPGPGLLGEHGFSVMLEKRDETILFDTGRGQALVHNAGRLKKDLQRVDKIVLSHGHSDHTGGIETFLTRGPGLRVYAHPEVFSRRYWIRGERQVDVSMPFDEETLVRAGIDLHLSRGFAEVSGGVYLTGEVPRKTHFEKGDRNLFLRKNGRLVSDPVTDDQSLVLETDRGLIVLLGCAHAGMINILEFVREKFPNKKMLAVIGGTHLGMTDELQFEETMDALMEFEIDKIGLSYCTGLEAASRLRCRYGTDVFFAITGYQAFFP